MGSESGKPNTKESRRPGTCEALRVMDAISVVEARYNSSRLRVPVIGINVSIEFDSTAHTENNSVKTNTRMVVTLSNGRRIEEIEPGFEWAFRKHDKIVGSIYDFLNEKPGLWSKDREFGWVYVGLD